MTQDDLQKNKSIGDPPELWPGYGVVLVDDLPNPIPLEKLRESSTIDSIQKLTAEIIRTDSPSDAQELLKRLSLYQKLQKPEPSLYQPYEHLVTLLKFASLYTLKLEELQRLFQKHLLKSFWVGMDLRPKIAILFLVYDEMAGEGEIHRALFSAITRNEETVGKSMLVIRGEVHSLPPSIRNWLRDYNQFTANATIRGGVERATYITQNQNAQKLSHEERKVLLRLLDFYDWMRLPSAAVSLAAVRTATRERIIPPTPVLSRPAVGQKGPMPPPPRPLKATSEKRQAISTPTQSPIANRQSPGEDLYRSTLEELQKMRQEYEKKSSPPQNIPIPERKKPLVPKPGRGKDKDVEYRPYSVNEAIIRGGIQENNNRGEILPGDQEIEDKLKKLEDKLK